MRSLPIDTTDINFVLVEIIPRLNFDTKVQEVDRDTGYKAWTVRALCMGDDKPEVLEVRVNALTEPALVPLTPIRFGGLAARTWSQTDSRGQTRTGVSFSAQKVDLFPAGKNGVKAPDVPVPA